MLQRRKILQYHTNKYNIHMYNFRLVLYVWVLSIIGILVINSAADGFAARTAHRLCRWIGRHDNFFTY